MAYHDVPSLSVRHLVVFLKRKKTDRIQNLVGSFVGFYFCNHLKPRAFPGFASFDKQVRTRKAQNLFLVALYRSSSLSFPSLICSPAHVFRKMVARWGDRITGLPWMAIFFDIFVLVETRFIFNVTHGLSVDDVYVVALHTPSSGSAKILLAGPAPRGMRVSPDDAVLLHLLVCP